MAFTTDGMKSLVQNFQVASKNDNSEEIKSIEKKLLKNIDSCNSSQEYIWTLFNLCVIQQKEGKNDFIQNLESLNSFLRSGLLDNSEASADFYYFIGVFNFKIHNYLTAKEYFEKSIMLEKNTSNHVSSQNDINGYKVKFNKRCRKAYCIEYLGEPEEAVFELIGVSITENDIPFENAIKSITQLYNDCQEIGADCNKLLKKIISFDLLKIANQDNLFSYVTKSKIKVHDEDLFNEHIKEITHILAHCMSESCIKLKRKEPNNVGKIMLLTRMSEILMKSLGDRFVTCYATLKAESKDFATADVELSHVRNKIFLDNSNSSGNEKIEAEKIKAEINFYIWYFSSISNHGCDCLYKEEFKQFCEEYGNYNSRVYYELFNFRHLLQDNFKDLELDLKHPSQEAQINSLLEEARENFNEYEPTKYCHKDIMDEWEKLKIIYDIYKSCHKISLTKTNLSKNLFDLWLAIKQYSKYSNFQEKNTSNDIEGECFHVSLECGEFLCISEYNTINNLLLRLGIDYAISKTTLLHYKTTNRSNILILSNGNSTIDVGSLISDKQKISPRDKYNILIDNVKNISGIDQIGNVYKATNHDNLIVLTILFSVLEECISKLQKPFSSFVISPINDGDTYSYQGCEVIDMLNTDLEVNIKDIHVPKWNKHLISCYNDIKNSTIERKTLDLREYKGKMPSHVICFQKANCLDTAYVFKLEHANTPYSADKIELYNEFILHEIHAFWSQQKNIEDKCHSKKLCPIRDCQSCFLEIPIQDENFYSLRDCLYSYLNLDIKNKRFMLIKSLDEDKGEQTNNFVICVFDENENICHDKDMQKSLCDAVRKGLLVPYEVSKRKEFLSITDMSKLLIRSDKSQPFFFISFRSLKRTEKLCRPVFEDCVNLNGKLGYWIDEREAGPSFFKDISDALRHPMCIGSFVYLSDEYLQWEDDNDYCFREIKLINEIYENNKNFIKLPILINGFNDDSLIEKINSYSEEEKIKACKKFFNNEKHNLRDLSLHRSLWDKDVKHIFENTNLRNALETHKIILNR